MDVPTHVASLIGYADGGAASVLFSFDSPLRRHGFVEITGTEATLAMPDPNGFGGEVRLRPAGSRRVDRDPGRRGRPPGRGLGALDMARALRGGASAPCSPGETGAARAGDAGGHRAVQLAGGSFEPVRTTFPVPEVLPVGWDPHARTLR